MIQFVNSAAGANLPFSQATRVGDIVYLSGAIGNAPGKMELVAGGIEAESRQMSFIEDDWMSQRDGTTVIRVVADQIEEHLRTRSILQVPINEKLAVDCRHASHYR